MREIPQENQGEYKELHKGKPTSFISAESPSPNEPNKIMNWLGKIRDTFRRSISEGSGKTQEELISKMTDELSAIERMATIEGVNFSKCQIEKIVEAYLGGKLVEFEALSPYLCDYNMATGEIWSDKLIKSDKIGLLVSKTLRKLFPRARLISLYDEYNSSMPDSAHLLGAPTRETIIEGQKKDAPQLTFSDKVKYNFKKSLKSLLRSGGAIRKDDKEGKDYLFVSESSKVKAAEESLVGELEKKGKILRKGRAVYFVNPEAENPAYREIQLCTANGRWLCEALDASSYLDKQNREITHLVVLPNEFKEQQDKVWEILRTLDILPENYHNIFYDQNVPPETVARVIQEQFEKIFIKYLYKNKK
ncbi:MAG: hypothetical protein NTZ49_00870 [Candidatus Parcubacteria bacterium]|nr:hypothetical protein [Candidatus Parcubacteria bacterium]